MKILFQNDFILISEVSLCLNLWCRYDKKTYYLRLRKQYVIFFLTVLVYEQLKREIMKRNVMKKSAGIFMILIMCVSMKAAAQTVSVGADVVSSYIWRGQQLGSVSFQPNLGIEYKGVSFGTWASSDLTKTDLELDFTVGYHIGGFSVMITDYWFNYTASPKYFNYQTDKNTAHTFEAGISYNFGESCPLKLSGYTNFAGADNWGYGNDQDYSTYIEAAYGFTLWNTDMSVELGVTTWEGAYSDGFDVVNISVGGSRDIKLNETFALPVFAKVTFNPAANRAYMAFGLSF